MPRTVDLRSSCRMWIEVRDSPNCREKRFALKRGCGVRVRLQGQSLSHVSAERAELQVYGTAKEGQEIVALIKGNVEGADDVPAALQEQFQNGWNGTCRERQTPSCEALFNFSGASSLGVLHRRCPGLQAL